MSSIPDSVLALAVKATAGQWTPNCAGEIFAMFNGEEVRIGHFQGCAADAAAVCALHNWVIAEQPDERSKSNQSHEHI